MDKADLKGYEMCWGEQGRRRNATSYGIRVKTRSETGTPLERLEGGNICRGSHTNQSLTTPFNEHFLTPFLLTKGSEASLLFVLHCGNSNRTQTTLRRHETSTFLLQSSTPPFTHIKKTRGFCLNA